MRNFVLLSVVFSGWLGGAAAGQSFYSLQGVSLEGQPVMFSDYAGRVVLVVNTASRCGFTPQYADLEELYAAYRERGFIVLGFPSNDYGEQEPGSDEEVLEFCRVRYGVTFPLFQKAAVSGEGKQTVFRFLTEQGAEEFQGEVGWNFEKFLIGRDGRVRARFSSFTNPLSARMREEIEKLLNESF